VFHADNVALKPTLLSIRSVDANTRAVVAGNRRHWDAALILGRSAAERDPTFAVAHTWLAWALHNTKRANADVLDASAQAVSLAATATDWERCGIPPPSRSW
jgi:hypothetical protein